MGNCFVGPALAGIPPRRPERLPVSCLHGSAGELCLKARRVAPREPAGALRPISAGRCRLSPCTGSESRARAGRVPPFEAFLLPAARSCFRLCVAALAVAVSSSGHFRWAVGVPPKQGLGLLFPRHPPCTLPRTAKWEDAAWSAAPPGLFTTRFSQFQKALLTTTSPVDGMLLCTNEPVGF